MFGLLLAVFVSSDNPAVAVQPPLKEKAWTILKDGAAEKNGERRSKALHALGLLTGKDAQKMLEDALNDPDKNVRAEAAVSLGKMHALTAKPKLRACLQDKEALVVLSCANTLYEFKDPMAYEVYFALLTEERKGTEGLVESQLDTLRDKKQIEKLAFETGIGFVPYGGMAWQAIQTVAHDDASPIRALAATRLATDPDPRSTDALADYLTDKKKKVRQAVIEAVARRRDKKLLNPVAELMDDHDDAIRFDAAAAVIRLSEALTKRPSNQRLVKPSGVKTAPAQRQP